MVWVSPSCEPITGHAPGEFLRDPDLLLAIVHPDDRALFGSHRTECRLKGDREEAEFRIVRPDGEVCWIGHRCRPLSPSGGEPAGRRSSNRDITKRKTAELQLRESERRYRSLFDSMDEGFALCEMLYDESGRPSDFRCLTVNPAFLRLTGVPKELVLARTARELAPRLEPKWIETFARILKSGRSERFAERLSELGKHYEVFAWRSDRDRFGVVFTDVTERARAEADLRGLNETLEKRVAERTAEAEGRAAQLRALALEVSEVGRRERLALASALHEHLLQILVTAKLDLDALGARLEGERLRPEIRRVSGLLEESLAWCRSATVSLSPPVLQEGGLTGGLRWLARQMQEQHGLLVDLSVGEGWVEPPDADLKASLFEAVQELLVNVVRHAGVSAARVAIGRDGGTSEIRVEDDGAGFDPATPRDQEHGGGRFGLFSIQQRLERGGGSMAVRSAPGRGTAVTLRIPIAEGPREDAAEPAAGVDARAPSIAAKRRSGRVRVIIADDHPIFRQGFIALLRRHEGIEVVGEAGDGAEAVELARALRPDVVVMDVSMPRMNGLEATRMISAELPGVRVIGLSMHEDKEIASSMREAGAVDFLTKGGPPDAAIAAIRAAAQPGEARS